LVGEVSQLLQLALMELEASKFQVEHVMKEKQQIVDQAHTIQMLMELV
jgi:hypothetical protein